MNLVSTESSAGGLGMEPGPVAHDSKMGLRLEQLIYHGFSDLERPSAWRKLSNRIVPKLLAKHGTVR